MARQNRARNKKMAQDAKAKGGFFVVTKLMEKVISKVKSRAKDRQRATNWQRKNAARVNQKNREWAHANHEKIIKKQQDYRHNNTEYLLRQRLKYANELEHQIKHRIRARLRYHFRKEGADKDAKTMQLVGCTPSELLDHLNVIHHETTGEIDHIFPLAVYDAETEQQKMTRWENLQMLTKEENNEKNDRLPTKAMAAKVPNHLWPKDIEESMLPDIYPGWATALRKY